MELITQLLGTQRPGASLVQLSVRGQAVETGLKTPTGSDYSLMGSRVFQMPGDFVLHQVNLPLTKEVNAPVLEAGRLAGKSLRVMAFCKRKDDPWTSSDDAWAMEQAADCPAANVVVLPSQGDASAAQNIDRANRARTTGAKVLPGRSVLIGLNILSPEFRRSFIPQVEADHNFFAIDLTGYKTGASNLNLIGNTVSPRTLRTTPFVFGYNAERWVRQDGIRGAAPIFLRRLGFQTVALRVYRPGDYEHDEDGEVRRYDPSLGGYVLHPQTPPIPLPPSLQRPSGLTAKLQARRWHENVWLSRETSRINDVLERGTLDAYRAQHRLLDASLTKLGIAG